MNPTASTVCRHLFAAFVLFCFLLGSIGEAQLKPTRRVLIFYELGMTYPGQRLSDEGIRAAFATSPYKLEVYREYMDVALFPDPADQQRFRDFYIRKYQNRRPDVIIAVGPSPVKLMLERHRTVFSGVPIVFVDWIPSNPVQDSDFTGVVNEITPFDTVKAALRLQPATRHIVVVGGTSLPEDRMEDKVKDELRPYERDFDISYLTSVTMPDLLQRLEHLPKNTIVLLITFGKDAAGTEFVSGDESSVMVAAAANAPVFSLFATHFNHGEVGGKLTNIHEQGRIAGDMALRILKGERPLDIPIVKVPSKYMFDWRALKRWRLKESDLPPGSIVLNRQPGFWELYGHYVLIGILVLLAQTVAIAGLMWQKARRRKAETELGITYDRLRMAVDAGSFVGWDWNIKTGTNRWFGNLETLFGIQSDSYFAGNNEFRSRVHPDDRDAVGQAIDNARRDRQVYAAEFRVPRENGDVRWVIARGKFYYASNGDAERMLGLAIDITDRKLAEEALRTVSGRLIQAQEQERARIARELHDDINQRLAMLQVDLKGLSENPPDSRGEVQERLEGLKARLSDTSTEVQAISHRLHSSKLEYLGLVAACKSFCREMAERQRMNIEFKADGVPPQVPPDVSLTLFRVLQESLQNGIKHSGALHFEVQLRGTPAEVQLIVRDDGKGFDVDSAMNSHGLGLISMRERVGLVKGALLVGSKPGGTEVTVRVPIAATYDVNQMTSGAA